MFSDHFSLANIPYGIATSVTHPSRTVATRLHDTVIFLDTLITSGLLSGLSHDLIDALSQPTVNQLAALPKNEQKILRSKVQNALSQAELPSNCKSHISEATLHLPVDIRGFTDFSCTKDHLLNASNILFKKANLPPGFLHFPIGYTGRASSIVVSGTPITRPKGQFRDGKDVVFGPSKQLDYELELGCIVGKPTTFGDTVSIEDADEHVFGLVLINDWSARDILGLEMLPLGPMNGKSFGTTMSPWIITLDALAPFEHSPPAREVPVASYLQDTKSKSTYDIRLQADLVVEGKSKSTPVCKVDLKGAYWSIRDLVAQQTVNGCNINTGDVLATGTISGSTKESHGCLWELTEGGEIAFDLEDGHKRVYLEDGDSIRLSAVAGTGVGFGDCVGTIIPAR